MTKKEYNGWTNYETWVVNLWIGNEQGSSNYWHVQAIAELERAKSDKTFAKDEIAKIAKLALADALTEHHALALPEVKGFAADLLGAAMSKVNWEEIAGSLIDNVKAERH